MRRTHRRSCWRSSWAAWPSARGWSRATRVGSPAVVGLCGGRGDHRRARHRVPPGFVAVTDLSFATVIPALAAPAAIHAYKWSLAGLLILPQSILLGMTFPLISGGIIRRWPQQPGETLRCCISPTVSAQRRRAVWRLRADPRRRTAGHDPHAGVLISCSRLLYGCWFATSPSRRRRASAGAVTSSRADRWFLFAAFFTGAASFLYEIGWIAC